MTFAALWRLVRARALLLVAVALLGAAAGAGVAALSPTRYSSAAEIFVVVNEARSAADIAQGAQYATDQARNFAEVATKQIVLQPVIDNLGLAETPSQLAGRIKAVVPLNTSIIQITATDSSPQRAARLADEVANKLAVAVDQLVTRAGTGNAAPVNLVPVQNAPVPAYPSAPNRQLAIAAGGLVAPLAVLAVLAMLEFSRARIRGAEHAVEVVGAPLVGIVSRDRQTPRHPMVLPNYVNSPRAEQYRQIRTSLRFLQTAKNHRAFVITSSIPGETKSTTAANLAAIMAVDGSRVCLVEGDLRAPSLGEILDLDSSVGFTTALTGQASLDDVLQPWGTDGLQVMLAGARPPNPSELLGSIPAQMVFDALLDRFDLLIVDAPPLGPVTDAAILSKLLGGALMVVSEGRADVRSLKRSLETMRVVDAEVLGTVVTLSRESRRRSYYHYNTHPTRSQGSQTDAADDNGVRVNGVDSRPVQPGPDRKRAAPPRTRPPRGAGRGPG